jgi:hypothetical protein
VQFVFTAINTLAIRNGQLRADPDIKLPSVYTTETFEIPLLDYLFLAVVDIEDDAFARVASETIIDVVVHAWVMTQQHVRYLLGKIDLVFAQPSTPRAKHRFIYMFVKLITSFRSRDPAQMARNPPPSTVQADELLHDLRHIQRTAGVQGPGDAADAALLHRRLHGHHIQCCIHFDQHLQGVGRMAPPFVSEDCRGGNGSGRHRPSSLLLSSQLLIQILCKLAAWL